MSYVFVEKEHSNEPVLDSSGGVVSTQFGIASLSYEDTSSLGSSNSDSGDIRRHTYTPTLVNSWIPRQDVRQDVRPLSYDGKPSPDNRRTPTLSSTLMPHSGVLPMIEIPDSCVEYIGRLMTGEIVEATALDNENEYKVYSNNSPTKLVPRFFGSPTRRSRSRCIAHIHLCECMAVFSCCIFT